MKDWRTHCFDLFGDIADDAGRNSYAPLPPWFQADVPGTNNVANADNAAPVSGVPPRLVVGLNQTTLPDFTASPLYQAMKTEKGSDFDFAAPGGVEIRYLIKHIYARLSQPFLNADGSAATGSPWPDTGPADDDEHWARRVAELFSLNAYTTPSTGYSGFLTPDKLNDGNLVYKLQDETDPAYPLVMECQQTVTGAVISRGFAVPVAKTDPGKPLGLVNMKMFGAGVSGAAVDALKMRPLPVDPSTVQTAKDQGLAQWLDEKQGGTTLSGLPANFGPGSSFVFNSSSDGAGQSASAHPHTAFVIRLARGDDKKIKAIQYFDVGGMNVPDSPRPLSCLNKSDDNANHAYEYAWSNNGQVGAQGKFRGLTSLSPAPAALQYAIGKLAKTRPLGFARLVLARRKKVGSGELVNVLKDDPKDWLLYASPLLRMYEGDNDTSNYAVSRYLWSLRGLPGADNIFAMWLVSIPRSDLAEAMVCGLGGEANRQAPSRTTTLTAMVADVVARKAQSYPALPPDKPLPALKLLLGTMDVCVQADGTVAIFDNCKSTTDPAPNDFLGVARDNPKPDALGAKGLRDLPWGVASTQLAGLDLKTLADLPAYFTATP